MHPEWYLIRSFSWKQETLAKLVKMRYADQITYGKSCCSVYLEPSGELTIGAFWTDPSLPEKRRNDYAALLRNIGVQTVEGIQDDNNAVLFNIDRSFFNRVNYLYSKKELQDCVTYLTESKDGLNVYACTRIEKNWYLFYNH